MLGGLLMRNRSLSGPGKFARLWASGLGTNSASSPSVPDSCRACSRKTARRLVPDGGATDGSVGTGAGALAGGSRVDAGARRSEEHTSELQSLMRISYAVFCLKKKKHCNYNSINTPLLSQCQH